MDNRRGDSMDLMTAITLQDDPEQTPSMDISWLMVVIPVIIVVVLVFDLFRTWRRSTAWRRRKDE
jgi:uncharacterized membrane protein YjdF